MIGIIGVVVSLGLLMYLAYRGVSVLILAPVLALLATLAGGGASILATYTEIYMPGLANFIRQFFPIFLLGAIFGKVMDDSGAAKSISHFIIKKVGTTKSILAVVLSTAILTYGGVSVYVVAFAVYPIGATLFRESGIPKRLLPASIGLGSFTFTMTALPGSPQIQNAIPMQFFHTDLYAAPILGTIAAIIIFIWGMYWLNRQVKKAATKSEGYGEHKESFKMFETDNLPSFFNSLLPILVVFALNALLLYIIFPRMNTSFLQSPPFNTTITRVQGTWSLLIALVAGIIVCVFVNRKTLLSAKESINSGAMGSLLPIMNTASEVGYGNVIAALAAFTTIQSVLVDISPNILVSQAITASTLAGITGSAAGGMSITLGVMGETFLQRAHEIGMSPQVLHRVVALGASGLDTLPHNGAVITLLTITGLTHKQSYKDFGMVTIIGPVIAIPVVIILAGFGIV
ncbi:MAG: GntP family permease [Treponema sp.]|nr:GntP family permease [Treponema sp.]